MRQKNTKNIKLLNLEEKKAMKEVKKPKKQVETKFKTVIIPDDHAHTQFIIPESKNSQEVIDRYLRSRKHK